jgi:hypothetical protein
LAAVALAATASATDCTVMPGCTACTDFIPNITAPGAASHQIHKSFHGLRRLLQPSSGEGSRGGPDALEGSDGPDGSDGSDDVDGPSSLSSPRSSSGRTSKIRGHRDSFGNFSGPTFAPNFTRITCTACDTAGYKLDAQKGVCGECRQGYRHLLLRIYSTRSWQAWSTLRVNSRAISCVHVVVPRKPKASCSLPLGQLRSSGWLAWLQHRMDVAQPATCVVHTLIDRQWVATSA